MSRRILALAALLVSFAALAPATIPVRAGPHVWTAWMYDHTSGKMLLLTTTSGSPQTVPLALPPGFDTHGRNVAISGDWRYMAYTVSNSGTNAKALVVFDPNSKSIVYSLPIEATDSVSLDFAASELVFNETSTSLAFGYSINNMQGWEIKAIQLGVGAGIRRQYTLPTIRRYRGSEVTFNPIALATEGSPYYDSYTWNIATGDVRRKLSQLNLPTMRYTHLWGRCGCRRDSASASAAEGAEGEARGALALARAHERQRTGGTRR